MPALPHPIPYQGSKRLLAPRILALFPAQVGTLHEPFAGSAAVSIAAASRGAARRFALNDALVPLAQIWDGILRRPESMADAYQRVWEGQLGEPRRHYDRVREKFNRTQDAAMLLYLLARCVKNAVRFNAEGEFNQSPDLRRLGMDPARMRRAIRGASALLAHRATATAVDFAEALRGAGPGDLVYLDPPWQGTSGGRDRRYRHGLDLDRLVEELARLNRRRVPFIVSFDGRRGERRYGQPLPKSLRLAHVEVAAGRSSQATLHGRAEITVESLYLSEGLRTQN